MVTNEITGAIKVIGLTQEAMSHMAEASQEMYQMVTREVRLREDRIKLLEKEVQSLRDSSAHQNDLMVAKSREANSYLDDIAMLIERRSR